MNRNITRRVNCLGQSRFVDGLAGFQSDLHELRFGIQLHTLVELFTIDKRKLGDLFANTNRAARATKTLNVEHRCFRLLFE